MIKRIALWVVLSMLLTVIFTACQTNEKTNETPPQGDTDKEQGDKKEDEDMKKSIDLYLIAGQSNGSGYTVYDKATLQTLWDKYKDGVQNVLYYGRAEYTNNVNTPQVSTGANEFDEFVPVKAGMGINEGRIGAEVGMASYLYKNYYNEASGKQAAIIKFAHGGTSLLNVTVGENAASGNWVSPSYAKALNVEHKGLTGGLYRGLLKEFKDAYIELRLMGYEEINVKGMFWMQGESDVYSPDEYAKAFKFFVDDLRADIGKIIGADASDFAVMVGEISRTSGSAAADHVAINEKFITMQRDLSKNISHVYTIASGWFEINTLDANGQNVNGQDAWHWTTAPMFNIGELVGECIVNNILGSK